MLRLIIELAVLVVLETILITLFFEVFRFGLLTYILIPMVLIVFIHFMEKV